MAKVVLKTNQNAGKCLQSNWIINQPFLYIICVIYHYQPLTANVKAIHISSIWEATMVKNIYLNFLTVSSSLALIHALNKIVSTLYTSLYSFKNGFFLTLLGLSSTLVRRLHAVTENGAFESALQSRCIRRRCFPSCCSVDGENEAFRKSRDHEGLRFERETCGLVWTWPRRSWVQLRSWDSQTFVKKVNLVVSVWDLFWFIYLKLINNS